MEFFGDIANAFIVLAQAGQEAVGGHEAASGGGGGGAAHGGGGGGGGGGAHGESGGGGSFLVSPGLGLMIWTLILFLITMYVLKRFAFPKIADALDRRATAVRDNIEASERQRREADELLNEYRARLKEAREQADDIVARARKASERAIADANESGKARREELVAAARKDIEAETRRSLEQIRREVADLTVLATEKVTRKSLDDDDHRRLVDEALKEVDFSALAADAKTNGSES